MSSRVRAMSGPLSGNGNASGPEASSRASCSCRDSSSAAEPAMPRSRRRPATTTSSGTTAGSRRCWNAAPSSRPRTWTATSSLGAGSVNPSAALHCSNPPARPARANRNRSASGSPIWGSRTPWSQSSNSSRIQASLRRSLGRLIPRHSAVMRSSRSGMRYELAAQVGDGLLHPHLEQGEEQPFLASEVVIERTGRPVRRRRPPPRPRRRGTPSGRTGRPPQRSAALVSPLVAPPGSEPWPTS